MLRIALDALLAGGRERTPLSVFPSPVSSSTEEGLPCDSVLEKVTSRLDLGEGPGDHRPPPATFGGRKVNSSGYSVTHPRRFLGQSAKVGRPVKSGA